MNKCEISHIIYYIRNTGITSLIREGGVETIFINFLTL